MRVQMCVHNMQTVSSEMETERNPAFRESRVKQQAICERGSHMTYLEDEG